MEDIERKLVKAKEFISMAKQNFEKNLYQLVCLQSNQAVEIMLKALIKQKTGKYPLEHHVDVLIERMGRDGIITKEKHDTLLNLAKELDYNYKCACNISDQMGEYTRESAEKCITISEKMIEILQREVIHS